MTRGVALLAAIAAVVVVVGTRIASPPPGDEIPLVVVPQGISAWTVDGERIFIERDGAVLISGLLAVAPDTGAPLRWCPGSEVFLDADGPAMWNADGRFITGEAERDMTVVPITIDARYILQADVAGADRARRKNPATVDGVIKARFDAWRAGQLSLGTDFCRDPVA